MSNIGWFIFLSSFAARDIIYEYVMLQPLPQYGHHLLSSDFRLYVLV
jgi:hypothetical protein